MTSLSVTATEKNLLFQAVKTYMNNKKSVRVFAILLCKLL